MRVEGGGSTGQGCWQVLKQDPRPFVFRNRFVFGMRVGGGICGAEERRRARAQLAPKAIKQRTQPPMDAHVTAYLERLKHKGASNKSENKNLLSDTAVVEFCCDNRGTLWNCAKGLFCCLQAKDLNSV